MPSPECRYKSVSWRNLMKRGMYVAQWLERRTSIPKTLSSIPWRGRVIEWRIFSFFFVWPYHWLWGLILYDRYCRVWFMYFVPESRHIVWVWFALESRHTFFVRVWCTYILFQNPDTDYPSWICPWIQTHLFVRVRCKCIVFQPRSGVLRIEIKGSSCFWNHRSYLVLF